MVLLSRAPRLGAAVRRVLCRRLPLCPRVCCAPAPTATTLVGGVSWRAGGAALAAAVTAVAAPWVAGCDGATGREAEAALLRACYLGDARAADRLLSAGCDANAVDGENFRPLLLAAMEGHTSVVALLLQHGADATLALDGEPALMLASMRGHTATAAALLRAPGADVDRRGVSGRTALMAAAANGHDETVAMLLEHGADVEARDAKGEAALVFAARYQHRSTVAVLLQHGAQMEAGNDYSGMRWANIKQGTAPAPRSGAIPT